MNFFSIGGIPAIVDAVFPVDVRSILHLAAPCLAHPKTIPRNSVRAVLWNPFEHWVRNFYDSSRLSFPSVEDCPDHWAAEKDWFFSDSHINVFSVSRNFLSKSRAFSLTVFSCFSSTGTVTNFGGGF